MKSRMLGNNIKKLNKVFLHKRESYISYITKIKKENNHFFSIINPTLISNPYISKFYKDYFLKNKKKWSILLFFKSSIHFYINCFISLTRFIIQKTILFFLYKKNNIKKNTILIDTHILADKVLEKGVFKDSYFPGLYQVLDKKKISYVFLPRIIGCANNPLKFIKLLQILKESDINFIFEHNLVSLFSIIKIFFLILYYPFQIFNIFQKEGLFNYHLVKDIKAQSLSAFTRYYAGKSVANIQEIKKIISWSEMQIVDRAFNFGVREKCNKQIYGVQAYLNYPSYFNAYIYDIDFNNLSSPHYVLANGSHYILNKYYYLGISFRYKKLFSFIKNNKKQEDFLALASHSYDDTVSIINCIKKSECSFLFKLHPLHNMNLFQIPNNIHVVNSDIYDLFQITQIVATTGSGTAVEAVACGISVIIIASRDGLTANPLVDFGQGEIWDIAFTQDEFVDKFNNLLQFRKNNMSRIHDISKWYKDNFFIEPTEENILKSLDLESN